MPSSAATARLAVFAALALCLVLTAAGPAFAADGRQLFASDDPFAGQFDGYSLCQPDAEGTTLAFVATPLPDNGVTRDSRVWVVDFSSEEAWAVRPGAYPDVVPGQQAAPTVASPEPGTVVVVWEQADSHEPGYWDTDLWIWWGDEYGQAVRDFPKPLVTGPAITNQTQPSLGVVNVNGEQHLVLAWQDDRDNGPLAPLVYALDLTDVDVAAPGYDAATAGVCLDPSTHGQYRPSVGPKGVVWVDTRTDTAGGAMSSLRYCTFATGQPVTAAFYSVRNEWDDVDSPAATLTGAAFLGPSMAGGPFQPWHKALGGTAGVIAVLHDPGELDAVCRTGSSACTRLAMTGRHGATDTDYDVFFWDSRVQQTVPVCTVGSSDFMERDRLGQSDLAVALGPSTGSTVVWADARHNPVGAASEDLTTCLWAASVPAVRLSADRTTVALGRSVTFTARVRPGMPTRVVRFQRGTRYSDPFYGFVRYKGWTTLATKRLSSSSSATWKWVPKKRGTYWFRVRSSAATLAVDGVTRVFVAAPSRVLKVVVK